MNLIEAMKIAEGVFAQYKIDQLKWWKRLDGTPMLNDLAVLFSLAFMEASTEAKDSTHRCKVGRVCDPETCTRALIEDKPNVSTSTNSSAPADVAAVRDAWLPIETAPEGELVICMWLDKEDDEHPARYNFDYFEDGIWMNYFSEHEHYAIAGVATGRSEDAPYTHWIPLPAAPTAQPQADGVKS